MQWWQKMPKTFRNLAQHRLPVYLPTLHDSGEMSGISWNEGFVSPKKDLSMSALLEGGGFVTTYLDLTEQRRNQAMIARWKDTAAPLIEPGRPR
jgi:hypothetical protein